MSPFAPVRCQFVQVYVVRKWPLSTIFGSCPHWTPSQPSSVCAATSARYRRGWLHRPQGPLSSAATQLATATSNNNKITTRMFQQRSSSVQVVQVLACVAGSGGAGVCSGLWRAREATKLRPGHPPVCFFLPSWRPPRFLALIILPSHTACAVLRILSL